MTSLNPNAKEDNNKYPNALSEIVRTCIDIFYALSKQQQKKLPSK